MIDVFTAVGILFSNDAVASENNTFKPANENTLSIIEKYIDFFSLLSQ
jgi:hypothetical protein